MSKVVKCKFKDYGTANGPSRRRDHTRQERTERERENKKEKSNKSEERLIKAF